MKVDMSPKAVTARLKTTNELWLLSVKLMNSKKINSGKNNTAKSKEKNEPDYKKISNNAE